MDIVKIDSEKEKKELIKDIDEEISKLEDTIESLEKDIDNLKLSDLQKSMILQELSYINNYHYINY